MIQITTDERDLNKDHPTDVGLVGDAKLVLRQLLEATKDRLGGKQRDGAAIRTQVAAAKQAWPARNGQSIGIPRSTSDSSRPSEPMPR